MKIEPADFDALRPDRWPMTGTPPEAAELIRTLEPGLELRAAYSLEDFERDGDLTAYPARRTGAWSVVARVSSSAGDISWMKLDDDEEGLVSGLVVDADRSHAEWHPDSTRSGLDRFLDGFGRSDITLLPARSQGTTLLDDPLLRAATAGLSSNPPPGRDLTIDGRYLARSSRRVIRSVACMAAAVAESASRGSPPECVRMLIPCDGEVLLALCAARALRHVASFVLSTTGWGDVPLQIWGVVGDPPLAADRATHQINLTLGCVAAILGSCDRVLAEPFRKSDGATADALRLALNVPRILAHESRLGEVEDAVRGAYYVEALTGRIVQGSWEAFRVLEREGGFSFVAGSGRLEDVFSRFPGGAR